MTETWRKLWVALLAAGVPTVVKPANVGFTEKPTAAPREEQVEIRFAVSGPTDVEVAILDGSGKVVRHLAGGQLGPNAPEPFQKASYRQSVLWDGKDDYARPVKKPVRVRVSLGLLPRLDRIIGWSGQDIDRPCGLACGPDGTLYAMFGDGLYAHRQTWLIVAFDRAGKYLRQVFPGPANLSPEKRKGWPWVCLDDGQEIPVVFHPTTRCPYPGAVFGNRIFPVITCDGRIIMLSGAETGTVIAEKPDMRGGRRLLILGCDGSVPENYLGPIVAPQNFGGFGHLALSPDEKNVYVAGLFESGKQSRGLCNVVWKVSLDGTSAPEVFAGKLFEAGSGSGLLNDPQGLATDSGGNLYVADYGNNRIVIFRPDGAFLREIRVTRPDQVRIHRKTGSVYVATIHERKYGIDDARWYNVGHTWKTERIVKLDATTGREVASWAPAETQYGGGSHIALDETADPPVLWFVDNGWGRRDILKIVDHGDRLEPVGDVIHEGVQDHAFLNFVGDVAATRDLVIVRGKSVVKRPIPFHTFNASTGEPLGWLTPKGPNGRGEDYWKLCWSHIVTGWDDGLLYIHGSGQTDELRRYKLTGEPAPFTALGTHVLPAPPYPNRQTHNTTLAVSRSGDIYYVVRKEGQGRAAWDLSTELNVRVVAADGTAKHESVVQINAAKLGGLAVDSKGNIYVGARLSNEIPAWFANKLPEDSPNRYPSTVYRQYGSIVKFPATGGRITKSSSARLGEAVGAVWVRRGGLVPDLRCTCEATRIDVDAYDRIFVPDVFRFSVCVFDSAGNEITRIGSYGNMDSRGAESPVPQPEIGFGWPIAVDCAGEKVYVADLVNRRIVAVRFDHAVEETVTLE